MANLFYKPANAWAADFIPFYRDGEFKLFYLHDWRNRERFGRGVPWFLITTRDFVHFEEHGEVLPRGTDEDQDQYVYTGCVVEADGLFHIFYTGNNIFFKDRDKRKEGIMHAVSRDLVNWEKVPEDTFYAPEEQYEPHTWRDPHVFWNEDAGEYWMAVTARAKEGPWRRRGCITICASDDLKTWRVREPVWGPGLYNAHECPEIFKMGDWWYLVYSEASERHATHYRMSRSLKGPWSAPENDLFDNSQFYAGKTATDGKRRYLFGWQQTQDGGRDYQPDLLWGGNLIVHELVQEADGTLNVKVPDSIDRLFSKELPSSFAGGYGKWNGDAASLSIDAPDSFACAVARAMPERCKISTRVRFGENTRGCGVMLRVGEELDNAYYIRLEPGRDRLVFDAWPRSPNIPLAVQWERPVALTAGQTYELNIYVDGIVCVVYLDNKVAMSVTLYNLTAGNWGVFVNEGTACFEKSGIRVDEK